jgi:hypothetical protein
MGRWNGMTVTLRGGEALRCEPATAERLADFEAVLGFTEIARRKPERPIVRLTLR